MANSGCLLLSNSGSMLPHSVPCPPAFLYLQQVSGPGPAGPRPPARRTCAPRRRPHPHLAASAPPPGPRCAPRVMAPGPGRGNCAPARRPGAGAPGVRAELGGGPEFGARSQLFRRRGRGRRAEAPGRPEGRGRGFSATWSLWGTSHRAAGGAERSPALAGRESREAARRRQRGRGALLQRGPRAGPRGRRATRLVGRLLGLAREAQGAPAGPAGGGGWARLLQPTGDAQEARAGWRGGQEAK